jgi:hypothetical protein
MNTNAKDHLQSAKDYVSVNWNNETGWPRLSSKYWRLIDAVKLDRAMAMKWAGGRISDGTIQERYLAAEIFGQLCNPIEEDQRAEAKEITSHLVRAASEEKESAVLGAIGRALSYDVDHRLALPALMLLTTHADPDVRYQATIALGHTLDDELQPKEAIARLIQLSKDADPDVRDWATSGLSSNLEIYSIDSREIRDAIADRLHDKHFGTRIEAFNGMAACGDPRGIAPLKQFLIKQRSIDKSCIEAAGKYGLPQLQAPLKAIAERWDIDDALLTWAIKRCDPDPKIRAGAEK